jgi:hypothetical protein
MAINQQLFQRLETKLGVGRSRLYARIQEIALAYHVSNHVAALKVAADSGISYQKYASDEDRAELRATNTGTPALTATPRPSAKRTEAQ